MKQIFFSAWLSFGVMVFSSQALAYEIGTHRRMSQEAANESILTEQLSLLDLVSLQDPVVFLPAAGGVKRGIEWILFGAEVEDDFFPELGSPALRFRNHFYNPLTDLGLDFSPGFLCSVFGTQDGEPSLEWGLVDSSGQDYSFPDARTYFLKALTEAAEVDREQNVALLLRTLGQLIHLIQDLAQPQHTRNDAHGPWCLGSTSSAAFYEEHTNDNLDDLPFIGYDPVFGTDTTTFNTPEKFWKTGTGKGLAEYSNRGFVTAGTNFDTFASGAFPNPNINVADPIIVDQTALCNQIGAELPLGQEGNPLPCIMTFLGTRVTDQFRSGKSQDNDKTSTFSIFDADLTNFNEQVTYPDPFTGQLITSSRLYTLNTENFDAANELLIPRAVGYSAGLINYFFRGKIDFEPDPTTSGQFLIENLSDEAMQGDFTLYYDAVDGTRQPVPGVQPDVTWSNISIGVQGQSVPLTFVPPSDPPPLEFGEYILVFTGTLGQETASNGSVGAVVGKQVTLPDDSFLSFLTPIGRISRAGVEWVFSPDTSLEYGNLDWKGKDVTLSIASSVDRYWGDPSPILAGGYGPNIYRKERVIAQAPSGFFVLGAAVQEFPDDAGKRLVAVLVDTRFQFTSEYVESVWQAPFPNPEQVPLSRVGDLILPTGVEFIGPPAVHPWMFNEDGTEARAVRIGTDWKALPNFLISGTSSTHIVRLTLNEDVFENTNEGPIEASLVETATVTYEGTSSSDSEGDETRTAMASGETFFAVDYVPGIGWSSAKITGSFNENKVEIPGSTVNVNRSSTTSFIRSDGISMPLQTLSISGRATNMSTSSWISANVLSDTRGLSGYDLRNTQSVLGSIHHQFSLDGATGSVLRQDTTQWYLLDESILIHNDSKEEIVDDFFLIPSGIRLLLNPSENIFGFGSFVLNRQGDLMVSQRLDLFPFLGLGFSNFITDGNVAEIIGFDPETPPESLSLIPLGIE